MYFLKNHGWGYLLTKEENGCSLISFLFLNYILKIALNNNVEARLKAIEELQQKNNNFKKKQTTSKKKEGTKKKDEILVDNKIFIKIPHKVTMILTNVVVRTFKTWT